MTNTGSHLPADAITLAVLAEEMGISPDSLRQRVHRGTLQAVKVGNTWVVPPTEALRVMREFRGRQRRRERRADRRAREIVANRHAPGSTFRRQPSGIDQHGGRA